MAGDRALKARVPSRRAGSTKRASGLRSGADKSFRPRPLPVTPQLASVKAVDDIYPMYGALQTSPPGVEAETRYGVLAPRRISAAEPENR